MKNILILTALAILAGACGSSKHMNDTGNQPATQSATPAQQEKSENTGSQVAPVKPMTEVYEVK